MTARRAAGIVIAALAVASACGGGQTRDDLFSPTWRDDGGRAIGAVRARLRGTRPPPGADVVVGVAGNADKLVGLPLAGGWKWTFAHPLDSRPVISGGLVIGAGGREVFALDAITGKKVWARDTGGLPLRGAGDDGNFTVLSLARGNASTLLAIDRSGGISRQIETDNVLGAPAVLGGYAFVPWASQYVSVIDPIDGDESARIALREKTSRAWTVGGGLYFGEIGIFRFDDHIQEAAFGRASHLVLPDRELPGDPTLMQSPEERSTTTASARDRIRAFARPSSRDGPIAFDAGRFYTTYFRLVMGFAASTGALAWVHPHSHDVLAGSAGEGELVICDDQGRVMVLDARTGVVTGERDLGEVLASCVVQIDGFRVPAGTVPDAPPLAVQIAAAFALKDPNLAGADRLLVQELARLDDDGATKVLLDRSQDAWASPASIDAVRAALSTRRTSGPLMGAALATHYDFLRDVAVTPPIGAIARALASLHDRAAAPLLAERLLDPAIAEDDVRQVAAALAVLADAPQLDALKRFFVLYRASAEGDAMVSAVLSCGAAILRIGGKDGRAMLDRAARDALTRPNVREGLAAMLAGN